MNALVAAAKAHPGLKFALNNGAGLDGTKLREAGLTGRCLVDFARTPVVLRQEVARLIGALGVEAIVFGSHAPFDCARSLPVKLANVERGRPRRNSPGSPGAMPRRFSVSGREGAGAVSRGRRSGVRFPVTRRVQPDSGRKVGKARPRAGGTGPRAWAACSSTLRAPQA